MERATYTHGHHESVLRSHGRRTAENSAAYLLPHLRPGLSLLDVGAGPGSITLDLARSVAPGLVTGVDVAPAAVARARDAADAAGLSAVTFAVADVFALPYGDGAFDVVHAHQVLQHLHDPVAALREMRRVVTPDGVVAVRDVDYGGTVWGPPSEGLDLWLRVYRAVHRGNGGEPDAGRRLRSWCLGAGFGEVTSSASIWSFAEDDERAWWADAWAVRATESDFARQAVDGGHATSADLRVVAEAWRTWGDDPAGTFLMPHAEVLARR